jgi:hypothetical protein
LLPIATLIFAGIAAAMPAAATDSVDGAAPDDSVISPLPACKGTPIAAQRQAFKLIKSDVCTDAMELLTGIQTGKQIGSDIQAVYSDLESNFSLKPLCAASQMADFVQRVVSGKLSVGFCPAGS